MRSLSVMAGGLAVLAIASVAACSPAVGGSAVGGEGRAVTPATRSTSMATADDVDSFLDASGEVALAQASAGYWTRACDGKEAALPETVSLYGEACTNGDGGGCAELGALYMCGTGIAKNDAGALAMFERSCMLRSEEGCEFFAGALVGGHLGRRDTARGLRVHHRACTEGAMRACGSLGKMLMVMRSPGAPIRAMAYLEKACEGGHLESCGNIAVAEARGLGGRVKDPQRAASIAREACEKANPFSCGVLGMLRVQGAGTAKDPASGARLLGISCNAGEASGCTHLGICHYNGTGVTQDVQKAAELFRKGCDGGDARACRILTELASAPQAAAPSAASAPMF